METTLRSKPENISSKINGSSVPRKCRTKKATRSGTGSSSVTGDVGSVTTGKLKRSSHSQSSRKPVADKLELVKGNEKRSKPLKDKSGVRRKRSGEVLGEGTIGSSRHSASGQEPRRESLGRSRRKSSSHSRNDALKTSRHSAASGAKIKTSSTHSVSAGRKLRKNSSHSQSNSETLKSSKHSVKGLRSLKETIGRDELPSSAHRATFSTQFDVDAPRSKLRRRPSVGTVESNRDHMTGEQRAWAGISDILDDDEDRSVLTRDVLPEDILQAMDRSVASLQSTSARLKSRTDSTRDMMSALKHQSTEDDEEDSDSESSHNSNMKRLCGYVGPASRMPNLMESSFSSLQSEASAKSLLSFVSAKNLIVQEKVTDEALRGFIGSITQVLEQKKVISKLEEGEKPSSQDPIFDMFTWSAKENVDEKNKAEEEEKRKIKRGARKKKLTVSISEEQIIPDVDNCYNPDRENAAARSIGYDPAPSNGVNGGYSSNHYGQYDADNQNPYGYEYDEDPSSKGRQIDPYSAGPGRDLSASFNGRCADSQYTLGHPDDDEKLQSTPNTARSSLNNSMPSLLSVREGEITDDSRTTVMKWTSFGDLNYDEQGPGVNQASHNNEANEGTELPQRKMIKKKIKRKVKKKKKKKKAAKNEIDDDMAKKEPEDLAGFFPGREDEEEKTKKVRRPSRGLGKVISRTFSKDGLTTPRADKQSRYKDVASPFKVIRNRIPSLTLFGKNKRGSPASVVDNGRQEAHFFDDLLEDDDEEEWGGLLD